MKTGGIGAELIAPDHRATFRLILKICQSPCGSQPDIPYPYNCAWRI